MDPRPRFRIDKKSNPVQVVLQCSSCKKDIRVIQPDESIHVNRGYYCSDCDDGAVHINLPE